MYPARNPHSVYVTMLVEHGIIGFLIFMIFIWSAWKEEKLSHKQTDWLAVALLAYLLVVGITLPYNLSKEYWLFLAIVSKISTIRKNELEVSGQITAGVG
jgi:O-antigen ligase